jgi:hypothetical protein
MTANDLITEFTVTRYTVMNSSDLQKFAAMHHQPIKAGASLDKLISSMYSVKAGQVTEVDFSFVIEHLTLANENKKERTLRQIMQIIENNHFINKIHLGNIEKFFSQDQLIPLTDLLKHTVHIAVSGIDQTPIPPVFSSATPDFVEAHENHWSGLLKSNKNKLVVQVENFTSHPNAVLAIAKPYAEVPIADDQPSLDHIQSSIESADGDDTLHFKHIDFSTDNNPFGFDEPQMNDTSALAQAYEDLDEVNFSDSFDLMQHQKPVALPLKHHYEHHEPALFHTLKSAHKTPYPITANAQKNELHDTFHEEIVDYIDDQILPMHHDEMMLTRESTQLPTYATNKSSDAKIFQKPHQQAKSVFAVAESADNQKMVYVLLKACEQHQAYLYQHIISLPLKTHPEKYVFPRLKDRVGVLTKLRQHIYGEASSVFKGLMINARFKNAFTRNEVIDLFEKILKNPEISSAKKLQQFWTAYHSSPLPAMLRQDKAEELRFFKQIDDKKALADIRQHGYFFSQPKQVTQDEKVSAKPRLHPKG